MTSIATSSTKGDEMNERRTNEETAIWALRWAGILGAIAVGAGAFGAHGLADVLSPERLETWKTGAHYGLVHSVALLGLAAGAHRVGAATWVLRLWVAGVLVFSGTLYALCLTGVGVLGAITPVGGIMMIAGWLVVGATARA